MKWIWIAASLYALSGCVDREVDSALDGSSDLSHVEETVERDSAPGDQPLEDHEVRRSDRAVSLPDVTPLDRALLDMALLDIAFPDTALPDVTLPDAALPDVNLPDATLTDMSLPDADLPDLSLADASITDALIDAATPDISGSCLDEHLSLIWPLEGNDAEHWVINNYVDLDPSGAIRDYRGGDKTYNGHRGVDIDIPSFREMDSVDAPAFTLSAASGVVTEVVDLYEDRHVSCSNNDNNKIVIEHENGYQTRYLHLKQRSALVQVGQTVTAGTPIAIVGSSGCSTAPHLHFEVRNCEGSVLDPFERSLWRSPPVYDTPFGLMDAYLREGGAYSINQLKDPPPDLQRLSGSSLGIGLNVAGGDAQTRFNVRVLRPDGAVYSTYQFSYDRVYRHAYWTLQYVIPLITGEWSVEVTQGSELLRRLTFER